MKTNALLYLIYFIYMCKIKTIVIISNYTMYIVYYFCTNLILYINFIKLNMYIFVNIYNNIYNNTTIMIYNKNTTIFLNICVCVCEYIYLYLYYIFLFYIYNNTSSSSSQLHTKKIVYINVYNRLGSTSDLFLMNGNRCNIDDAKTSAASTTPIYKKKSI